jgi:hypothetical protein
MSTLARELGFLARRNLAQVLDHHSSTGMDWRGLVDQMGFSYEMNMLLSTRQSPTLSLLEEWERVLGAEATLDKLIDLVGSLGCKEGVDVLTKAKAEKKVRLDSKGSLPGSASDSNNTSPLSTSPHRHHNGTSMPTNRSSVAGPSHMTSHERRMTPNSHTHSGIDPYVLSHHMERLQIDNELQRSLDLVRSKQFDVFLSFSREDEEFAEEVRSRLTTQAHMRVFVPSDDLMPGKVFSEQIADMIKSGCRKTIILLSPNYLESEWCSYEARMALHVSPDCKKHNLIPILFRSCQVPRFLEHIYYLDYPRYHSNPDSCQKFFWARLFRAVNHDPTKNGR